METTRFARLEEMEQGQLLLTIEESDDALVPYRLAMRTEVDGITLTYSLGFRTRNLAQKALQTIDTVVVMAHLHAISIAVTTEEGDEDDDE